MAHVVSAYALGGFLPEDERREKLDGAVAALEALRLTDWKEPCWGYHFPVQTRVFFYPEGAPNTIATSFAGLALLDAHEVSRDERLLELAVGAGDFFLRRIPRTETAHGTYFAYLVDDRTPIHNANTLACALLARLGRAAGRKDFRVAAEEGLRYAIDLQRPDGSWPYGEEDHLQWIDGYHTSYVLQCLMTCDEAGMGEQVEESLRRGLDFYRRELFLPDGTPKYLTTSLHPIDAECVAQGIQAFARAASRDPRCADDARRVFDFAMRRMRRRDQGFLYQRRRLWVNPTPHVRWVAASMMLALAHLLRMVDARGR